MGFKESLLSLFTDRLLPAMRAGDSGVEEDASNLLGQLVTDVPTQVRLKSLLKGAQTSPELGQQFVDQLSTNLPEPSAQAVSEKLRVPQAQDPLTDPASSVEHLARREASTMAAFYDMRTQTGTHPPLEVLKMQMASALLRHAAESGSIDDLQAAFKTVTPPSASFGGDPWVQALDGVRVARDMGHDGPLMSVVNSYGPLKKALGLGVAGAIGSQLQPSQAQAAPYEWVDTLGKAISEWSQPKGTAQQLMQHLSNYPGALRLVKQLGLADTYNKIESAYGTVTKGEAEAWTRSLMPNVTEKVYSDVPGLKGEVPYQTPEWNAASLRTQPEGQDYQEHVAHISGPTMQESLGDLNNASQEEIDKAVTDYNKAHPNQYASEHWFGIPNPLWHTRSDVRPDVNGIPTLYIDELQSDWGQDVSRSRSMVEILKKDSGGKTLTPSEDRLLQISGIAEGEGKDFLPKYQKQLEELGNHPFETTWPLLGIKRMISEANDRGLNQIAWTSGEIQGARSGGLADWKWFYDKELPNTVNKWAKAYGARVDTTTIPGVNPADYQVVPVRIGGGETRVWQVISKARKRTSDASNFASPQFDTQAEAIKALQFMTQPKQVHRLRLTPQLSEAAAKGFGLAAGGGVALGLLGADEAQAQQESPIPKLEQLTSDPRFQQLPEQDQLRARNDWWLQFGQHDPRLEQLSPDALARVRAEVIGLPQPGTLERVAASVISGATEGLEAPETLGRQEQVYPELGKSLGEFVGRMAGTVAPFAMGMSGMEATAPFQLAGALAGKAVPEVGAVGTLFGLQEAMKQKQEQQLMLRRLATMDIQAQKGLQEQAFVQTMDTSEPSTAKALGTGFVKGVAYDLGFRAILKGIGLVGRTAKSVYDIFRGAGAIEDAKRVSAGLHPNDNTNLEDTLKKVPDILDPATQIVHDELVNEPRLVITSPTEEVLRPMRVFLRDGSEVTPQELTLGARQARTVPDQEEQAALLRMRMTEPDVVDYLGVPLQQAIEKGWVKGAGALKKKLPVELQGPPQVSKVFTVTPTYFEAIPSMTKPVGWKDVGEIRGSQAQFNRLFDNMKMGVRITDLSEADEVLGKGYEVVRIGAKYVVRRK